MKPASKPMPQCNPLPLQDAARSLGLGELQILRASTKSS
jgi:hypothetical protein